MYTCICFYLYTYSLQIHSSIGVCMCVHHIILDVHDDNFWFTQSLINRVAPSISP